MVTRARGASVSELSVEELSRRDVAFQQEMLELDVADLTGLGAEEIDFEGVDADLAKFQRDEIVQEALSKGVDLRLYSRQIETDLKDSENQVR